MERPGKTLSADAPCVMAGDIGGTKTNVGLFLLGKGRPEPVATETFPSGSVDGIEEIIDTMLKKHPASIAAACFGIAGPVIDGEAATTNLPWVVSEKRLEAHFGWHRVRLINDLGATAMAIPLMGPTELEPMNSAPVRLKASMALVAPGTGLGQALLVYHGGRYLPLPSEGGHVDFAPTDEVEMNLWRYLRGRFGHVSVERLLSGQGIVNIYEGLKSIGGFAEVPETRQRLVDQDPARAVAEAAIDGGDPLSRETLERFCRILGAVAGNLALTGMTTGGVFVGGGIPPKILPILKSSPFMDAFRDKGRFSNVMETIGVRVIVNDKAALLGAAVVGSRLCQTGPIGTG